MVEEGVGAAFVAVPAGEERDVELFAAGEDVGGGGGEKVAVDDGAEVLFVFMLDGDGEEAFGADFAEVADGLDVEFFDEDGVALLGFGAVDGA